MFLRGSGGRGNAGDWHLAVVRSLLYRMPARPSDDVR
jgi:hypothetical protein